VPSETVKHLTKTQLFNAVGSSSYNLCMSEDCDVIYFNDDNTYYSADIIVPVWFKTDANPKYICYCSKVTKEEIEQAVFMYDAKTIKDVVKITGAMKNADCIHNNPTGKCCSEFIKQVIEQSLTK